MPRPRPVAIARSVRQLSTPQEWLCTIASDGNPIAAASSATPGRSGNRPGTAAGGPGAPATPTSRGAAVGNAQAMPTSTAAPTGICNKNAPRQPTADTNAPPTDGPPATPPPWVPFHSPPPRPPPPPATP